MSDFKAKNKMHQNHQEGRGRGGTRRQGKEREGKGGKEGTGGDPRVYL